MEVEQDRGKRKRGGEWKSNGIEGREREEGSGSQDRGKRKRGGETG